MSELVINSPEWFLSLKSNKDILMFDRKMWKLLAQTENFIKLKARTSNLGFTWIADHEEQLVLFEVMRKQGYHLTSEDIFESAYIFEKV